MCLVHLVALVVIIVFLNITLISQSIFIILIWKLSKFGRTHSLPAEFGASETGYLRDARDCSYNGIAFGNNWGSYLLDVQEGLVWVRLVLLALLTFSCLGPR